MKVALLSDCYPPRVGGIESQVRDLARHLVGDGHDVEVFTATAGPRGEVRGAVERDGAVTIHRMAEPLLRGVPVNPFAGPAVRRRLQAGGFDVAHVHVGVVSPFAWDMARLSTGLQLPTALTWHCVLGRTALGYRWSGALRRWVERGAVLSAVSRYAARHVRDAAPPGTEVAVLPNAIDLGQWAPRPVGDGRGRGVTLVSTMRLAPRKRPIELVETVATVASGLPKGAVRLDLVGDGPLRGRVERRISELGIGPVVRLHGRVPREELLALYSEADAYVAPTRLEAFGIAVLEARAAGLPVVAMRGSGVDDIITEGESGLLAGDDAELVRGVRRLVTDDHLRTRIAEHNRSVPPTQTWPVVIKDVLAEYERAREEVQR